MKNLELEGFGLVEIKDVEIKTINGGWWEAALAIGGAIIYLYNEGPDFFKGFKEGYNSGKPVHS